MPVGITFLQRCASLIRSSSPTIRLLNKIPPQNRSLQILETNLQRYRAPADAPGISKAVLDLRLAAPSFSLKQLEEK